MTTMRIGLVVLIMLALIGCKESKKTTEQPQPSSVKPTVIDDAAVQCKGGSQNACKTACDKDNAPSCLILGEMLLKSSDRSVRSGCKEPLRKACNADIGRACSTLGSRCLASLNPGAGVGFKAEKAQLNLKACELGDGVGCSNAAKNADDGDGVPRDLSKASQLREKAFRLLAKECDGGDARSCLTLAMKTDPETAPQGIPKDAKKALDLYRKACEGGEQIGCNNARRAANTKTRDSDGATMVQVTEGPFTRGSTEGQGDPDEEPQGTVTVSAFWIDKTEVTAAQYRKCVEAKGCTPASASDRFCNWGKPGQDNHPINCVRWDQANAYCEWAGARLPTEAEWEKAARGTDGRTYPWGNTAPSCQVAIWFDHDSESHACGHLGTWPVGSKPEGASPYGAVDMAGNVWEWVADGYDAHLYRNGSSVDPRGPDKSTMRVLRGGGFGNDGLGKLRAAERFKFAAGNQTPGIGFRCVVADAKP